MTSALFTLSAFGDEIADDLSEQLSLLRRLEVGCLELRAAWGTNVLKMGDDDVARVKATCDEFGIAVSAIGSPIGKSPLAAPIEDELGNLVRICHIADALGTRRIRVFSFYPPDTGSNVCYDEHVDEAIASLSRLTDLARSEGVELLLENEKGIVGDTPERCRAILAGVNSPHLRFAWDPANFVQVGVARPMDQGWPLLSEYVGYVHIKDAAAANGSVRAAGEGDGQVGELLARLRDGGYRGVLALEPHLAIAGHSSGFSGVGGMTYAVQALRRLMAAQGCVERKPDWAANTR